ncbi:MAG: extracellular solute-binding protein, partial [Caldilineae bacterium]
MIPHLLRFLKRIIFLPLAGLTALAMVACASATGVPVAEEETPAAPAATPLPLATAADAIPSNPQPSIITLTFWGVEQFSPQVDLVAQQVADFEAANPNIKVKVFLKKPTGQAGIPNYLASASKVAPGVLPDVVVLSTDQLPQAWRNDLIQPLTGKLDRTISQDLLPAARQLGTVDGELAGIPFQMDVEHLVYNTTEITPTPVLWTDVLSGTAPYRFPAKGQNGLLNDASLIQYLAAGASLTDPAGNLTLDEAALRALLTFYQAAVEQGILDPQLRNIGQTDDLWAQYVANPQGMVHTTAHHYLT